MSGEHMETFLITVGGVVCLFVILLAFVYAVLAVYEKVERDLKARRGARQ